MKSLWNGERPVMRRGDSDKISDAVAKMLSSDDNLCIAFAPTLSKRTTDLGMLSKYIMHMLKLYGRVREPNIWHW